MEKSAILKAESLVYIITQYMSQEASSRQGGWVRKKNTLTEKKCQSSSELWHIYFKGHIKRHVTLHTLRHTFGSTMLRRGVPIEVVSKVMGHANVTVTYTKYIHVLQEQQAQAMCGVVIC